MRYEDASQTGAAGSDINARDDADHLAANDFGPASGNLITGSGTITGATGTDSSGHIVAITGAGGSDDSIADGKLEVAGQYGTLTIDGEGNYTYARNPGSPEGVSDVFTYTLANDAGATDTAKLTINIGDLPILQAEGTQTVRTADGVVVLPPGVQLSDVRVVGRDLVITLPDGSTMVIPDGAVFVPQLVLDGVAVPASNLAALLIDSEPRPAAGDFSAATQSSGGNFGLPPGPLDPGVPLGDLLPPTELFYTPPEVDEIFDSFDNDPPVITPSAINVSEEGVSSIAPPNPDNAGSPDTTNLRIVNGHITVVDPDGDPFTITLGTPSTALTSQGVAITWSVSPDGHTVTGSAGVNVVVTLVIDNDGNYTVTLSRPVDHPNGGGEQGISFVVPVFATDGEDTATPSSITVTIEDDSPTIEGRVAEPNLIVDDTTFNINDSDTVSGAFAVSYGADGPAASNPISYAMGINAGSSGLFDTLSGAQVILTLEAGVVVGRAGAGGPVVFTVSVDGAGNVTLDQSRAVVHNDPADPVESGGSAATLAADNLVTVSIVATDRDGDQASITVNIGQNLHFEDDGPSVSLTSTSEPQLTVDDTTLGTNASASFAGLFAPVFGNDGPAAGGGIGYALSITAGPSGIFDVATGEAVNLVMNGAVVEGRSAVTNELVFTVSVNGSGVVTLDQVRAVQHNDPADPVESGGSAAGLSLDSLVRLTATVTDGDGDSATATVNIGSNLHFEDDGPSVSAGGTQPSLTVDETVLAGDASASFAGIFAPNFGADGAALVGSVTYALGVSAPGGVNSGLVDSLSGHSVFLFLEGGQVVGREGTSAGDAVGGDIVFTVSVNGAGVVTLDQQRAVIHDDPSDPDEASSPATLSADNLVTLTATVTDRDGDTATATANIGQNLNFEDDGPSVTIEAAEEPQLIVDETNLPANIGPVSFIDSFNIDFGEDGPASSNSTSFSLSITEGPTGLVDTATGNQVFLFLEAGQVVGREGTSALDAVGGDIVFTVSVNAAGDVSLNQQRAVVHGDPTDHDEADTPAQLSADDLIRLNVVVADADGDTASASINIARNLSFEDDGPSIIASGAEPTLTVDDTTLGTNASSSFAGVFITNFGNDGQGSPPIAYALGVSAPGGVNSGLVDTATGNAVFLFLEAGQVVGREGTSAGDAVGGDIVFTVSVNGSGVVTLDQVRAVQHNDPADPVESGGSAAGLSADNLVTLTATIEDGDGDTATATVNIGSNLKFEDDGPSITATGSQPTLTVDETLLGTNASAGFAGAFTPTFGNDGQGSPPVAYALGVSAPGGVNSGLVDTATGNAVFLFLEAGQVVGREGTSAGDAVGGDIVFTVSVNGSGTVTLDQVRAVVHNDPADHDENTSPAMLSADNLITLTATVEDGDGDTATATINIGQNLAFEDDGLTANDDTDSIIGGAGPATGNVITAVDIGGGDINTTDGVADTFGNDGPGQITRIESNNNGNIDTIFTAGNLVVVGQYGTLTINANGNYSYTRTDLGAAGVSDVFTYTVTDGDGDTDTATLTIGIADNFPTLPDPDLVLLDDDVIPAAGGNLDGPGDDNPDTVPGNVVNGQLNGSGGDAPLTYSFTGVNTLPVGFSIGAGSDADTLLINQGATLVMTIQLNLSTGAFTVTQNAPILHPADNGGPDDNIENNLPFSIGVRVQDADGDTDPATITINVDDDTPTVSASTTQPDLTTDDSTLGTNASSSFAGVFATSFGADGAALVNSIVYTLGVSAPGGVNSGVIDVATGNAVFLFLEAGQVVGREGTSAGDAVGGDVVFTVSVDASGLVTLDQVRAVQHNDPADPVESGASAAGLSLDTLVTLTATITDRDGDAASATANIGSNLHFEDAGPTVVASGVEPQLVVDDTTLGTNASASFAGLFIPTFGADGAGAGGGISYALAITPGASGIIDVATGQAVNLVMNGSVVEGRTAGSNQLVFTVTVDSAGVVTLDQIRAVQHNDPLDPVETGASAATLTLDSLVRLTATVTDKDGDTATATVNIGTNLRFEDDGPQAIQPDPATLENEVGATTGPIDLDDDGEVIIDFGADGPGLVQFDNITDHDDSGLTSGGDTIRYYLSNNDQTLQAKINANADGTGGTLIFTVQINQASGDYTVTMAGTIDNGSGVSFDDLTSGAAGNVNYRGIGEDDPATTVDIILSASLANGAPDGVNTDSNSIGVGNQSIDVNQTVRIDLVTDLEVSTVTPGTPMGFTHGGHVDTNSFIQTIAQVQSAQSETVAFRVYALDTNDTQANEPDRFPTSFANSSIVTVTEVTVIGYVDSPNPLLDEQTPVTLDISGVAVGVWTAVAYGISVQKQADGSVIFSGVQEGDQYGISTGANDFNAVAVTVLPTGTNGSTEDSLDLGVFAIGQVESGDPIDISFDLQITDGDGDTVLLPGAIDITIEPASDSLAMAAKTSGPTVMEGLSPTSSLLAAETQEVERVAANSNSVTLAAAVGAAGLAASSLAAAKSTVAVQDEISIVSAASQPSVADIGGADSFDGGLSGLSALRDGGFDFGMEAMASTSYRAIAAGRAGELTANLSIGDGPTALLDATDMGAMMQMPAATTAMNVGMVSAESMVPQAAGVDTQMNAKIGLIVQDALQGGGPAPSIDALLSALPGGGLGDNAGLRGLATPDGDSVPIGDMGHGGVFTFDAASIITSEALALHPDAVQPVANG